MIFLGEPPVGLLNLLRSGVSGDAEDGIVVLEARQTVWTFREAYLSDLIENGQAWSPEITV
jgi:hypothetical protein